MKLETVTIKDVLAFREPATLDVRALPPGLVAIVGLNGRGKTTTLEAALGALYRQFPSRADRPLVDYALSPDAYLEVTFEVEGQGLYTARVNLDGPHRKSEAVLLRVQSDGQPVCLNDGKLTTYDAAVAALLPPKALMLASVFAAQNRHGSFVRLDRKGRKDLFASLLGLDHYEAMADRARTAATLVDQALGRLHASRQVLARDVTPETAQALHDEANRLQVEGGRAQLRQRELATRMAEAESRLAELAEAVAAHAAALVRRDGLTADLLARRAERATTKQALADLAQEHIAEGHRLSSAYAQDQRSLDEQIADTTAYQLEIRRIEAALEQTRRDADTRIANNQLLLAEAEHIRGAAAAVAAADEALSDLRRSERTFVDAIAARQQDLRDLEARVQTIAQAEQGLARARQDAALLGTVPCGGTGPYLTCQFLTNATAAQAQIAELERGVASGPQLRVDRDDLQQLIGANQEAIETVRAQIRAQEHARRQHEALARRLPELRAAEERIAAHEQRKRDAEASAARQREDAATRRDERVVELRARLAARRDQYEADKRALADRLAKRKAELELRLAASDEAAAALQQELDRVAVTLADHEAASAQASAQQALLATYRHEWDEVVGTLARVATQRDELARRRADYEATRGTLACLDQQIAELEADLVEWQLLAKALGRDGLPVLEIDAAGPTVSSYCNDLLQTCFGSRFSVDLVTQEAKQAKGKDGSTMKDAFELKVFDAERGGEPRDLQDLSGGEQILVDEALKSAIALLVNTKHAQPIRTCWRDETTGALDGENAGRYLDMLRRVQQLGGFHHVFFVTHNPDAALQADAQVVVAGGHIAVQLPPYAAPAAA